VHLIKILTTNKLAHTTQTLLVCIHWLVLARQGSKNA
jgi:hypothetical protein